MSGAEEYGVRSIPPRYDEYNSLYVHNSQEYEKTVEEIDSEKRDMAEAEIKADQEKRLELEEYERLSVFRREDEKRVLESIHLKEKEMELRDLDASEYEPDDEEFSGTNVDLLA